MNITLVYNPKSGSAHPLRELHELFSTHGIAIVNTIVIKKGFESTLKTAISGSGYIAVIGGDGTISTVAGLIAGTNATLIPLPGGTFNHFTKDLGIDQNLDTAIKNLPKAKTRYVDIATVNNLYFINNSSIGIYPASLRARKRLEDRFGKWPAAIVGSLRALIRYRSYDIEINNQHLSTPFVFVGNNDYRLDTFGPEGRTALTEGVLSVYILSSSTRLALIKIFAHALVGKLDVLKDFTAFKAESFTIKSSHPRISVSHDGEVSRITTPLTYSIKKAQLRVL